MYLAFKVVPNGRTTRRGISRCVYPLFDSRRKESPLTSSWRKIRVCVRNLISLFWIWTAPRETVFGWSSVVVSLPLFFSQKERERERGQEHTICSQQQQQQQQQQRSDNSRSFLRIERERMRVCVCVCVCTRVCVNTRKSGRWFFWSASFESV